MFLQDELGIPEKYLDVVVSDSQGQWVADINDSPKSTKSLNAHDESIDEVDMMWDIA